MSASDSITRGCSRQSSGSRPMRASAGTCERSSGFSETMVPRSESGERGMYDSVSAAGGTAHLLPRCTLPTSGALREGTRDRLRREHRALDRGHHHSEPDAARVQRSLAHDAERRTWLPRLRDLYREAAPCIGQPTRRIERVGVRTTLGARDRQSHAPLLPRPLLRRCHE
jgi:hypothetical protein